MNVRFVTSVDGFSPLSIASEGVNVDTKSLRLYLSHGVLFVLLEDGRLIVKAQFESRHLFFDPVALSSVAVALIALGDSHMLFATRDARLFGVGSNSHSQLATPSTALASTKQPVRIASPATLESGAVATALGVGDNHSVVLFGSRAFACGANLDGQCGVGQCSREIDQLTELKPPPKFDASSSNESNDDSNDGAQFVAVCCGPNFSVLTVLRQKRGSATGTFLVACGFNMHGELASGAFEPSALLQRMLFEDEQLLSTTATPTNIVKVSCGRQHVVCVDDNGEAYATGSVECAGIDSTTRANRFMLIEQLAAARIVDVACAATQTAYDDQHRRCFIGAANGEFSAVSVREQECVVALAAHFKTALVALSAPNSTNAS